MPKVALLSRVIAKKGRANQLIAAYRPIFERVEREPGTLVYVLHRSTDNPDLFWVSELYADVDAFAAHNGSSAMASATPPLAALIAESELLIGEPLHSKSHTYLTSILSIGRFAEIMATGGSYTEVARPWSWLQDATHSSSKHQAAEDDEGASLLSTTPELGKVEGSVAFATQDSNGTLHLLAA